MRKGQEHQLPSLVLAHELHDEPGFPPLGAEGLELAKGRLDDPVASDFAGDALEADEAPRRIHGEHSAAGARRFLHHDAQEEAASLLHDPFNGLGGRRRRRRSQGSARHEEKEETRQRLGGGVHSPDCIARPEPGASSSRTPADAKFNPLNARP